MVLIPEAALAGDNSRPMRQPHSNSPLGAFSIDLSKEELIYLGKSSCPQITQINADKSFC
jgi:hypothetical protein